MLHAVPKRWFSWDFDVMRGDDHRSAGFRERVAPVEEGSGIGLREAKASGGRRRSAGRCGSRNGHGRGLARAGGRSGHDWERRE